MMAKTVSSKPSIFFKKLSSSSTTSDPNSFRRFDHYLKVLRRLRPILVKDPDVPEILDRLTGPDEAGLRADWRDLAAVFKTREERVQAFLDRLEQGDEPGVFAFIDTLRDRHRHLGSLLDKMIRNFDSEDEEEGVRERTAVSGEALRKILKDSSVVRRRPLPSSPKETRSRPDPSAEFHSRENGAEEWDDDEHLNCFVVSTRGRMQTEKWIKHSDDRKNDQSDGGELDRSTEKTFMAVITKDLVFRRTSLRSLPVVVKQPPAHCKQVYILDDDSKYCPAGSSMDDRRHDPVKGRSFKGHSSRSKTTESFRRRPKDVSPIADRLVSPKTVDPVPPPLPPKPDNLPHLSFVAGGNPRWQSSSTDTRETLSSVDSALVKDNTLPSTHRVSGCSTTAMPRQPDKDLPGDYSSCNSDSCRLVENGSIGCQDLGQTEVDDEAEEGDDLSLNFAVEVEDPEPNDDLEDPYETVNSPDDPDAPSTATVDESVRRPEMEEFSGDHAKDSLHEPVTQPPVLQSRIKPEVDDSSAIYSGKLNARDSGVDSVVSQGFPDSPFGPEPGTDPEVFPSCDLGDLKIPRSDADSTSTDYSYYEDIELFSASQRSPSIYLDPNSGRSGTDRRNTSRFPFGQVGGGGTSSDQKVVPCGTLLLAETEHVWSPGTSTSESVVDDSMANFRGAVLGYDKEGFAYYLPGDSLRRFGDPQYEDWFYPIAITPHEASIFLSRENQKGCFVVYRPRNSTSGPAVQFVLSVCRGDGDIVHYSIVENVRGDVKVEGHDHTFMTVCELVSYFRRNQSHLAVRLRRSLKDARLPITPGHHFPERMEIPKGEIHLNGAMTGHGRRGMLCNGQLNGSPVTVKVLAKDSDPAEDDDFLEEAQILLTLRHENVIRLIGLSCRSRPFYIVTESCERGTLLDCLQSGTIRQDCIEDLFDVCLQVVSAMFYLEGRQFVLHRALAAKSFLVTRDLLLKLTNFDCARFVQDDNYIASETEEVPVRWAAPEVLLESSYSTKSDVWAAGTVFWEVFSAGVRPYAKLSDEETAVYVTDGGRLEKPGCCNHDLFLLMKSCWRPLASDRPSFKSIQEKFKGNSSVYYYSGQTATSVSSPVPPPKSPRMSDLPQLPVKAKVSKDPARLSATPTIATKTRHPSVLRESRSADGTLRAISEGTARDSNGRGSGGGLGAAAGSGAGGAGGPLKVPSGGDAYQLRQSGVVGSSGGERMQTSSSDSSSVVSVSVSNDFDKEDLSRGEKIRKSIRKLITGKKTAK